MCKNAEEHLIIDSRETPPFYSFSMLRPTDRRSSMCPGHRSFGGRLTRIRAPRCPSYARPLLSEAPVADGDECEYQHV